MTNNEAAHILKGRFNFMLASANMFNMDPMDITRTGEAYIKAINLLQATTDEKEEQTNGEEENTPIK